jgi:penicillin-binding protein 2
VMKPHLVKIVEDGATRARTLTVAKESYRIALKQSNIDLIKAAMVGVTSEAGGTASKPFLGVGYTVGGKTGTAQVIAIKKNEKYNAKLIAERLRDNALFTAFAPADKPRIVLAIVVENGGFGAGVAAPIARKALDFYLLGKRPNEKDTTKVPKEDAEALHAVEAIEEEAAANPEPKPAPAPVPVPVPAPVPAAAPLPAPPARPPANKP